MERDARRNRPEWVQLSMWRAKFLASSRIGGAVEVEGLAFSIFSEGTLASLPRKGIEENNGGVTDGRVRKDATAPVLYQLSYSGIAPEAGIEPALPR